MNGCRMQVCFPKEFIRFFSNLEVYWIAIKTFDLGQNMVGWCRLKFEGVRGYGVYIRQGEILTLPTIAVK